MFLLFSKYIQNQVQKLVVTSYKAYTQLKQLYQASWFHDLTTMTK